MSEAQPTVPMGIPPVGAIGLPVGADSSGPTVRAPATRVLHLINGEHYSGAERVQDLLAARLPDEGFEVGFACVKPDQFPHRRKSKAAPLHELPMRSRVDVTAVGRLARLVRREGYALVHAHTPRTSWIGRLAALRAGVPYVYHVHSPAGRDSTRRWQDRINGMAERLALTGRVPMIGVSEAIGQYMRGLGFAPERIHVVPNGVPAVPDLPDREPPAGTWTLGTLALFRPRKGIEVLLEALAQPLFDHALVVQVARPSQSLLGVVAFAWPERETAALGVTSASAVDEGQQPVVEA